MDPQTRCAPTPPTTKYGQPPTPHRFTVAEYLATDVPKRTELINGVIYDMPPPGPPHANYTARLGEYLTLALKGQARVWQEKPLNLAALDYMPQPDITLLNAAYNSPDRIPTPADVRCIIEVADGSFRFKCTTKAPLYLAAGIYEFIILNIQTKEAHWFHGHLDCITQHPFNDAVFTLTDGLVLDLRAALRDL